MNVPFNDLTKNTQQIKEDYLKSVDQFLDQGRFILTEEVEKFEHSWAKAVGTKFCIGTSSGADALYLALRALDIKAGDEVITQGNAYNATVTAILRVGAVPRFCDINEDSLTLDVTKLEDIITDKTKAILPVHQYGQSCDIETVVEIAKKHNLYVIEDCAQAHLTKFKDKYVGNWGDVATFSFYPTKNLGAFGDGGAVVTNNEEIKNKINVIRNLGKNKNNQHEQLGYNMRLDPIQAICLNLKLPFLEDNNDARIKSAKIYNDLISNNKIKLIKELDKGSGIYHLYIIRILEGDRDKVRQDLLELGIQTAVHYPVPVYDQPFYKESGDPCPITDKVSEQVLSLPLFLGITKEEQEYVANSLKQIPGN
ncbi:MAG: hypothetical protein CMI53_03375 [Parcubacteria group bacterium]|nr:hypothetical protein [Parcubacteria group bacterium]|tara:strand:+ start:10821 stop:11921 length:1101 start_codon:yes stop_codon:yes gene_type:complete